MPILQGDMFINQEISIRKSHSFFISGDTIKIRVREICPPLSLSNVDDFGEHFPDVAMSSPERSD